MKVDFEASEWLDERLIAYHMTTGAGVNAYDQRWSLQPSNGGCRFTFDEHVELPFGPIGRMLGAVGRRTSERHLEKMLATRGVCQPVRRSEAIAEASRLVASIRDPTADSEAMRAACA